MLIEPIWEWDLLEEVDIEVHDLLTTDTDQVVVGIEIGFVAGTPFYGSDLDNRPDLP